WTIHPLCFLSAFIISLVPDSGLFREAIGTGVNFTHSSGPSGDYYLPEIMGAGVALFDYDGDGDLDLLLIQGGPTVASRQTKTSGVADPAWSTSATFFDYDNDGRPDLFVAHYVQYVAYPKRCASMAGVNDYCSPQEFRPTYSRLFHNEGGGHFHDLTQQSGI